MRAIVGVIAAAVLMMGGCEGGEGGAEPDAMVDAEVAPKCGIEGEYCCNDGLEGPICGEGLACVCSNTWPCICRVGEGPDAGQKEE